MGFLSKLFTKGAAETATSMMDSAGGFAKDLRTAITGDIPPEAKAELIAKTYEIEGNIKIAQAEIIKAEAGGQSWLQRNWRPMVMIWFAVLISLIFFDKTPPGMEMEVQIALMDLLKIGLGGYVIGQSAEVIADKWNKT